MSTRSPNGGVTRKELLPGLEMKPAKPAFDRVISLLTLDLPWPNSWIPMDAHTRWNVIYGDSKCEFSFKDTLVGRASSSLHPVDIDSWNQSVPLESDFDMAAQFLDPDMLKDDSQSITSSMNDSAYMSQPDMSQLQDSLVNMRYHTNQDVNQPILDGFIRPDMLSPTLSSTSHATCYGQQADLMLPPSVRMQGHGIPPSFTNSVSHQMFMGSLDEAMVSGAENQQFWSTASQDEQDMYSNVFDSGSPLGATPVNRALPQTFAPVPRRPQSNSFQSENEATQPRSAAAQRQPTRAATLGSSISRSSSAHTIPESISTAPQRTVNNMNSIFALPPTVSPSASLAGQFSNHTFQEPFNYIDYDAAEDNLENSTEASVVDSSTIDMETEVHAKKTRVTRPPEDTAARSDPLYQCTIGSDDLYHCPYADNGEDCGHRPTKLKCNYDKYIDSHLKPFRCKQSSCQDVQFSSTACLLRHEREAHGMHGHGAKPHLCHYVDCERAQEGNGFPRRYNLFDHMKRVHDFTGPTTSPERVISPVNGSLKKPSNKRKSGEDVPVRAEKKTKVAKVMPPPQSKRDKEIQSLRTQWTERRHSLENRFQSVHGPTDVTRLQQMSEDIAALLRITRELNELG